MFLHGHCGGGGEHSLPYRAVVKMKKHSILKCIVNNANCANVYIIRKQESTSLFQSEDSAPLTFNLSPVSNISELDVFPLYETRAT